MIVTGVLAVGVLAAWIGHTDASRAMASDLDAAFDDGGLKHVAAVDLMGLSNEPQLSRQLAGAEPMNLFRLASLPDAVKLAFYRRQLARMGATVLEPSQVSLIRGAALLGARRMLKIAPDLVAPERRRA